MMIQNKGHKEVVAKADQSLEKRQHGKEKVRSQYW